MHRKTILPRDSTLEQWIWPHSSKSSSFVKFSSRFAYLANTRGSVEAENFSVSRFLQMTNSNEFLAKEKGAGRLVTSRWMKRCSTYENTFFHILHAVVIFIEHFLCVVQVGFLHAGFPPRQTGQPIQIVRTNTREKKAIRGTCVA